MKTSTILIAVLIIILGIAGVVFQSRRDNVDEEKTVAAYFYNASKDSDSSGNILCSKNGIVRVVRESRLASGASVEDRIEEAVNFVLEGEISAEEKNQGISTEYPLDGLTLKNLELTSSGVLELNFDDPNNKTSGGSCRVTILRLQIEETVLQFPEVRDVRFEPEFLFQP